MPVLLGPFLLAAAVLGMAGLAKLLSPEATDRALHQAGLPSRPLAVRALGAVEFGIAVAAALVGGLVLPLLVAAMYAGFAGFVLAVRRSADVTSCGCFGAASAPPGITHIVFNGAAAAISVAYGLRRTDGLLDALADHPLQAAVLLCIVGVGTYLAVGLLTNDAATPTSDPREFSIRR